MRKHLLYCILPLIALMGMLSRAPLSAEPTRYEKQHIYLSTACNSGDIIKIEYKGNLFTPVEGLRKASKPNEYVVVNPHCIVIKTDKVTYLRMNDCGITQFYGFLMTDLQELYLPNNKLGTFSFDMQHYPNLVNLSLAYNNLVSCTISVRNECQIRTIAMEGNCLSDNSIKRLLRDLPARSSSNKGRLCLKTEDWPNLEYNLISQDALVGLAEKNWTVVKVKNNAYVTYSGETQYPTSRVVINSVEKIGAKKWIRIESKGDVKIIKGLEKVAGKKEYYKVTGPQWILEAPYITLLDCRDAKITSVDLKGAKYLRILLLSNNFLDNLNVWKNRALTDLVLGGNLFKSVDLSQNFGLTNLSIYNNPLTKISLPPRNATYLNIHLYANQLQNAAFNDIINALPYLFFSSDVYFKALEESEQMRSNSITTSNIEALNAKGFRVIDFNDERITKGTEPTKKFGYIQIDLGTSYRGEYNLPHLGVVIGVTNASLKSRQYSDYAYESRFNVKDKNIQFATYNALYLNFDDWNMESILLGNFEIVNLELNNNRLQELKLDQLSSLASVDVSYNRLRKLILPKGENGKFLSSISIDHNQLPEEQITQMINDLPDRTSKPHSPGTLFVRNKNEEYDNRNIVTAQHVQQAKAKNWNILNTDSTAYQAPTYYSVSIRSTEGGTITVKGFPHLKSVPAGTELSVEIASIKAGYELTSVTANGKSILPSMKFKVEANTEIVATFNKEGTSAHSVSGQGTQIVRLPEQRIELLTPQAGTFYLYSMTGELLSSGTLTDKQVLALPENGHAVLLISYANGQSETYKL